MKVTLEELEVFSTVVKSGSFSRAADDLELAASVVSRSLKKLETKLNCSLLNRTTRSLSLTQEGEWLFTQAAEILDKAAAVEAYFLEDHPPQGIVTVDAATPFTLHAIVPLIAGFNKLYPDVTIVLESSESISKLIEKRVDIAIRIGDLENSTLKARKIGDTYRGIYASPAYIERYGSPKNGAALESHRCLGFTKSDRLNTWPVLNTDKSPITINPKILASSGEALRQLALQGNGIACLSAFVARQDIAEGRLISLLEKKILRTPIPVHLVYYSDKALSSRVRCFIDYIIEFINFEA